MMPLWQRLLVTLAVILGVSFIVGVIWQWLTGYDLPSYLAGVVGGVSGVPAWEFLKRVRRKDGL